MRRLIMLTLCIPLPAFGQSVSPLAEVFCDTRAELVSKLEIAHGAQRQGTGLRGPDAFIEVWAVPSTGAWTLVQSYASGRACIIAMGDSWETPLPVRDPA